jgi:hypothetical protein
MALVIKCITLKEHKMNSQLTRTEKAVTFVSLWIARIALSVLAFAGMMHFLGGVDVAIAYPISFLGVAFLLKETL